MLTQSTVESADHCGESDCALHGSSTHLAYAFKKYKIILKECVANATLVGIKSVRIKALTFEDSWIQIQKRLIFEFLDKITSTKVHKMAIK